MLMSMGVQGGEGSSQSTAEQVGESKDIGEMSNAERFARDVGGPIAQLLVHG